MDRTLLGFDKEFDHTAVGTRRQAGARVAISVLVFLTGITAIPLPAMLVWATIFAVGDSLLWIATDPRRQARSPVVFRSLRLVATLISSSAWVLVGMFWWSTPGDYPRAVAIALIAGVLLYMVRGCHRSMVQMLAAGLPPTLMLVWLPFTGRTLTEKLGLSGSLFLLLAYALSSAINAWQAHRRLQETTLALVAKQREAEAASVAKSEFLANMSHEIRTPRTGVLAMAHVLNKADLGEQEMEAARLICSSGEMLERLLSDILDLAKVEAGQLELELAPFQAGDLVRNAGAFCRPKADEKGIRLSVTVEAAADRSYVGDAIRIRQIITNMLSNAVKFTTAGDVSLALAVQDSGQLRFTVTDTGVGFDPSLKARLFERFQQADGSITRQFGGSGLGLAISQNLAEAMGGTLDCDSNPGVGARFWLDLDLPAADGLTAPLEDEAARAPKDALRILAADDHPTNLKVVEIILGGAGIAVTSVENGLEALGAHARGGFDLILMDMQMPVMDGLTAVSEIRAAESRTGVPRVPIIMLTANTMPEHVRAGRLAGADGHLTKPLTPSSLFQAIEDALAPGEDDISLACGAD